VRREQAVYVLIGTAQIVMAALHEGIILSAHAFYCQPDPDLFSHTYLYWAWNAAVVEVQLDVLTGNWRVLRCDCVIDVGESINPGIDIGQVEGGFIQGMGWLTMEQVKWDEKGVLLCSAETYEIPQFRDIPIDFRIALLPNAKNPHGIHSSKACGESPVSMSVAVVLALRNAIFSFREQQGITGWIPYNLPATKCRLQAACGDVLMDVKKGQH